MKSKGLESLAAAFHSEKVEDAKRLEKSGLPVFRGYRLPYPEFKKENSELIDFLRSCKKGVVIRALPQTPKLPRRYKIGVKGFEPCLGFLKQNVVQGNTYIVYLTEWEPQDKSAIIISGQRELRAEVGNCSLDELSHGRICTLSGIIDFTRIGHVEDKTIWQRKGDLRDRKFLNQALRFLELTRDSFNPLYRRGYFELISTESGKVKFVDYKINPMYIK